MQPMNSLHLLSCPWPALSWEHGPNLLKKDSVFIGGHNCDRSKSVLVSMIHNGVDGNDS